MAICMPLFCVHVVHVIKTDMIADEMRDPRSAAALGFFIFFWLPEFYRLGCLSCCLKGARVACGHSVVCGLIQHPNNSVIVICARSLSDRRVMLKSRYCGNRDFSKKKNKIKCRILMKRWK